MSNANQYIPKEELIIFSRQLSLVIESEVSLVEGLQLIQSKSDYKALTTGIGNLIEEIQTGHGIGDSLKKYEHIFSPFFLRSDSRYL
jgi:type II secretory pathway component PulF